MMPHQKCLIKCDESMLLSHRAQGEHILCLFPAQKLGEDGFRNAFRDRERKTNCKLYRENPDLNYLLKSSLGEDG